MYQGVGLPTARGSGTNGYTQRNVAQLRNNKDKVKYKTEQDIAKADASLNRAPNPEILLHERKRKVELKCLEMQELMEEQGYSEQEINDKIAQFRKVLLENEEKVDENIQKKRDSIAAAFKS